MHIYLCFQLNEVDCIGKLNSFIEENGDWLMDNGINRIWGLVLEEKEKLYKQVIRQIVYYRYILGHLYLGYLFLSRLFKK